MNLQISKLIGLFIFLAVCLTACGGGDTSQSQTGDTPEVKATATAFPTFAFVAPTNPPVFNQNAEATVEATAEASSEATLDPQLIERGLGRYEALECGTCHGENGEGTDKGGAINKLTQSEDEFITFMRSGGDIGTSHQYSTDRLSARGATNLYAYLKSLATTE